jgi:phage gpG-like protein
MKMSAKDNAKIIADYFASLTEKVRDQVAPVVAETATEYYKECIMTGQFDGVPFKPLSRQYLKYKKRNKDKILYLNGLLFASIRPAIVETDRVVISAGSSKVPYAQIQNEGGTIYHPPRSETFQRNRYTTGAKGKMFGGMGAFKKGIKSDKIYEGQSYKGYNVTIPQRRYMGPSAELNQRIITRIKSIFKTP